MNSKLSVFETMQEMLRLSAKHFRLLLVVGAAPSVPGIASQVSSQVMSQLGFAALGSLLAFVLYIFWMVVDAACRAATLGVLSEPAPELVTTSMRTAVRTRSWTLFRISILLALIAIPFGIVIGLGASLLKFGTSLVGTCGSVILGLLFLIFMKYALADPLAVVKKIGARESLKVSWHMTRGHFGYVLGCYLLLGIPIVVGDCLLPNLGFTDVGSAVGAVLIQYVTSVLTTPWIVLSWVMYLHVTAADAQPEELAPPTSAPEVA